MCLLFSPRSESPVKSFFYVNIRCLNKTKNVDFLGDSVSHHRLLGKLRHCGINGRTLQWIADFLSGRTQRVFVDRTYSRWSPVHSEVPQGTVLGPLLFLIYINDLPDSVNSTVRLFADDCLVYREVGSIDDQLALQRDLYSLENWAHIRGMKFNPSKCTILTISRSPPLHKFYSLCGTIVGNYINED